MPLFLNLSMVVYKDPEAKKVWGECGEVCGACVCAWCKSGAPLRTQM